MAVGDVYEIVDGQQMFGQTMLNVYFYKVTSESITDNNAESVANAFIDFMLVPIADSQSTDILHNSVKVRNLFDDTDAFEALVSVAGTAVANTASAFEAYPFRLVGDNAAVRPGAKRIPGVGSDVVTDGVVTDAGVLSSLIDLALQMALPMPWGLLAAELLTPVIVKRILSGGEYRLPENSGEAILSTVVDALFNPVVSSQVSRKVGVGE